MSLSKTASVSTTVCWQKLKRKLVDAAWDKNPKKKLLFVLILFLRDEGGVCSSATPVSSHCARFSLLLKHFKCTEIQVEEGLFTIQHIPEYFLDETQVESDTLGAAFFIRGGDGGEFTVPRLAALIPTGHLKDRLTLISHLFTSWMQSETLVQSVQ